MDEIVRGTVFVVGDNVDTDQIIPAEYLSRNPSDPAERPLFGQKALSGVPAAQLGLPQGNVPFVAPGEMKTAFGVIVAGRNFGCGSSREHAPLAIAEAGCRAVIAESYARIFYRNSVNGGLLLPLETPDRLIEQFCTGDEVEVDVPAGEVRNLTTGKRHRLNGLGEADEIIAAGGIFGYARKTGMLR